MLFQAAAFFIVIELSSLSGFSCNKKFNFSELTKLIDKIFYLKYKFLEVD